jgi:hypothetical protein
MPRVERIASNGANADKEFGAPVGTEAACDFAVGGGGAP